LASQVVTLDQLSEGRAILSVGLGALDAGLGTVGEVTDRRERAELLDEGIDLIASLWAGDLRHDGRRHQVDLTQSVVIADGFGPVQRPRVPIWVVGAWPSERSMRRVLRYDGLLPHALGGRAYDPALVAAARDWIGERRTLDGFEIVVEGTTPADDGVAAASEARRWADAGATWWIESNWETFDPADARLRIEAGPPR
jgi:alkanesulfonate monooxygenase SsuD/methylene tetrahydromethanopterin reductase-like flavin-dependent oxidoreductase (luciferase family)